MKSSQTCTIRIDISIPESSKGWIPEGTEPLDTEEAGGYATLVAGAEFESKRLDFFHF